MSMGTKSVGVCPTATTWLRTWVWRRQTRLNAQSDSIINAEKLAKQ